MMLKSVLNLSRPCGLVAAFATVAGAAPAALARTGGAAAKVRRARPAGSAGRRRSTRAVWRIIDRTRGDPSAGGCQRLDGPAKPKVDLF